MMKRPIFSWIGLMVLFLLFSTGSYIYADIPYKVKRGDTLERIAKKHGVQLRSLKEANNLSGNVLKLNQVLIIPKKQGKRKADYSQKMPDKRGFYIVKRGDTLSSIARRIDCSVGEIKRLNHLRSDVLRAGQKLVLIAPVAASDVVVKKTDDQAPVLASGEPTDKDIVNLDDELEEDDEVTSADHVQDIKSASSAPLGKWSSKEEQKLFVRVVMGFLGTPYRLGGQSIRGLDCSAFVKKIYEFFEVQLPRTAREQAAVGMSVPRDSLQEGDLVFFNTKRAFGHVGIYIGNNNFIHASYKKKQVKVDSLNSGYYSRRFVKGVRLKKFDEGV